MQRALILRSSLALGWLLLALSGQTRATEQQPAQHQPTKFQPQEQKILVLGDSISAAYGMSLEQGWVAQLAQVLQKDKPGYAVINASISGDTTAGGLRRLPALLTEHAPGVVIVELGANDGLRGYPLPTLQKNLTALVTTAQQAGAKVILLQMEIPPNYGARYTSGFRATFKEVAEKTACVLGPFLLDGVATDPELIQEDGLHPNVAAQPLILNNVLPTVNSVLAGS